MAIKLWIFKIVLECELTAVGTLLCIFLVANCCDKPPRQTAWAARELQTAPGDCVWGGVTLADSPPSCCFMGVFFPLLNCAIPEATGIAADGQQWVCAGASWHCLCQT